MKANTAMNRVLTDDQPTSDYLIRFDNFWGGWQTIIIKEKTPQRKQDSNAK